MATIRPLAPGDLAAVVRLMQAHLLARPLPGGDAEAFLRATVLDHPWADPELPSLVAVDDTGAVVGFIASHPRRMCLDDRRVKAVCCSHLVVAPESRAGAVGALLVRRLLSGPQALTFSDTGVEVVVRLFRAVGGHVDHTRCCDWMLVLRPLRWLGGAMAARLRNPPLVRSTLPIGALPLQAAGPRLAGRAFPEPEPDVEGEELQASELVEHLPEVTRGTRLRPDYDEAHLEGLFNLIGRTEGGLVRRLVRCRGRVVGWYVYALSNHVARVLQLVVARRSAEAVLQDLVEDARSRGAGVLAGRLEPQLDEPLAARIPAVGLARRPIVHSHDADVSAALAAGSALLTRLEAEWWVI